MKFTRAKVARHLGVDVDSLMHVVERDDQIVVILTDYRKLTLSASALAVEEPVRPQAAAKK